MTSQDKNLGSGCTAVIAWGLIAAGCYVIWKLFNQPFQQQELFGQLVGVVFCFAFGGAILIGGGRVRSKAKRLARGRAEEPERPWLWRDDWAAGRIEASFLDQYGTQLFVGGAGLLFAIGGACGLLTQQQEQPPAKFALGVGVLVLGLVGAGWLALCVLSRLWHGSATLEMARTPAVIGGRLEGVVTATAKLRSAPNVKVTLRCLRTTEKRQFGNSRETEVVTNVLWEDERVIDRLLDTDQPAARVGVPIRFWIPSSQAETNEERQIAWRLEVTAATPVVRFKTSFEVPVFETKGAPKEAPTPDDLMADYEVDRTLIDALAAEGVRYDESVGSVTIISPPRKLSVDAFFYSGFTLLLAASTFVWIREGIWLAAVINAAFVPLLAYAAAGAVLGCAELRIQGDRWRVRHGWAGFGRREEEFLAEDIQSFRAETQSNVNVGTHMRASRHVYAVRREAGRVLLVRSLSNRATERWLIAELRKRAGLENPDKPQIV